MRSMSTQPTDTHRTDPAATDGPGADSPTMDTPSGDAQGGARPERRPLLLTLRLAEPGQLTLQALRNRHFPPARNLVPAHVSLFHALPGDAREPVTALLRGLAATRPPVLVEAPRLLGFGVAFPLVSDALAALHARLARAWWPWLTAQDRQPFRPHVTVQNKVTPEEARRTRARLARGFVPWTGEGTALLLWRYLGGPWELLETLELAPATDAPPDGRVASGGRPRA